MKNKEEKPIDERIEEVNRISPYLKVSKVDGEEEVPADSVEEIYLKLKSAGLTLPEETVDTFKTRIVQLIEATPNTILKSELLGEWAVAPDTRKYLVIRDLAPFRSLPIPVTHHELDLITNDIRSIKSLIEELLSNHNPHYLYYSIRNHTNKALEALEALLGGSNE